MKLASLKFGLDGKLVVVSDDLAWYADAAHIAPTMQAALDDWDVAGPALELLATDLAHGVIPKERFHERAAAAPLPRAFLWMSGGAGPSGEAPAHSDILAAARDDITLSGEAYGCDTAAEIVVVTGNVPQGVTSVQAADYIRLVGVANDISLHNVLSEGIDDGAGLAQAKPAAAFSPVFVTPSSLGDFWQNGTLVRTVMADVNGAPLGRLDASNNGASDFGALIAHLAMTRGIGAGSIIGSGPLTSQDNVAVGGGSAAKSVADGGIGYGCIADVQMAEKQLHGDAKTPFLTAGDTLRIDVRDDKGHSVFGAIEQSITAG